MIIEVGILLIMLAGIMNGSFVIPARYIKNLNNDQVWFFHAFIGLIIVPWLIIAVYFPDTITLYSTLTPNLLIFIVTSGLIFGLGQVCFAYAIRNIGISISFAVNLGIGISLGSIFVLFYRSVLISLSGFWVILAITLILLSLLIFYISGKNKLTTTNMQNEPSSHYLLGWILVSITGLTSGLQNITFIVLLTCYAQCDQVSNPFWIWPPFLTAAAISMLIGFWYRVKKQPTDKLSYLNIISSVKNIALIILMGILFTSSLTLYGTGMNKLSLQQQIIGWPLFMVLIILTSQLWGWLYSEFHQLKTIKKIYKIVGVLLLIMAVIILASIETT